VTRSRKQKSAQDECCKPQIVVGSLAQGQTGDYTRESLKPASPAS
jgi:hypothetical protein